MRFRLYCLPVALLGVFLLCQSRLLADMAVLSNGGEVRGEFVDDRFNHKTADLQIRTVSGAVLVFPRSEVTSVTRRRLAYEEYEVRRRNVADTLEAQWDLAEWCRANDLRDRRQSHLKRVLDFNPEHLEARRLLGYKRVDGEWKTQDEIMAARGYVKYKGRYVLPQELELIAQEQKESEAEKGWYKKVRLWHAWLTDGRPDKQNEGLANLRGIRDPNAIPALYKTLAGDKNEDLRLIFVGILANIQDERALGPLVNQSLQDESADVRHAAVKGVARQGVEKAIPFYVQSLKNDLNQIVNRAAYALGELARKEDLPNVAPQLINALVTTHRYKVKVLDPNQGISIRSDGSMVTPGFAAIPPDISLMLATGQLPYGVQVNEVLPPGLPPRTKLVTVKKEISNMPVLEALKKLTRQDFRHDVDAWRNWWQAGAAQDAK